MYVFTDGFVRAYILRHDLQMIFSKRIPLHMFTASIQMFDVTKGPSTTEKPLMIDMASARQCYSREEKSHAGLASSENNLADGLEQECPNDGLEKFLDTGCDQNTVRKWIVRDPASSSSETLAMRKCLSV